VKQGQTFKDGSKDIHAIYYAIGVVVSKWEHLETRLLLLYSTFACDDYITDVQAYSAIISFRGRMTTIQRLAEHRLQNHRDLLKECSTIIKRIERLSTRRNQVVHGAITNLTSSVMDGSITKNYSGFYISNSIYGTDTATSFSEKAYYYNADDLLRFALDFQNCQKDLNEFIDKCRKYLPFGKSNDDFPR
jgi:hypothetical protein